LKQGKRELLSVEDKNFQIFKLTNQPITTLPDSESGNQESRLDTCY